MIIIKITTKKHKKFSKADKTSMVAMHLVVARIAHHLLPTSNIDVFVYYLFSIDISVQHA